MFDPSIFDNLKVVIEGGLYDLDRSRQISVIGRQDLVDLASMSRTFFMQYKLPSLNDCSIKIALKSELSDFAAELAQMRLVNPQGPGCSVCIQYRFQHREADEGKLASLACELHNLWEDADIRQKVEFQYPSAPNSGRLGQTYYAEVLLKKKAGEEQIEEFSSLLQHSIFTLQRLEQLIKT